MEALAKTSQPFVRNPSSAIEADHYTPAFCCLNLRDPVVCDYWLSHWKAAHDNVGLEGIFLDSSFNLSSDKFHWIQNTAADKPGGVTADQTDLLGFYRPAQEPPAAILSQYLAHLQLMAAMQKDGYQYCNEDLGVFGIHRHGSRVDKRLDSLPIWGECLCGFDVPVITKAGRDPEEVFFRGLAYRIMWSLHWNIASDQLSFTHRPVRGDFDLPTAWHLGLLRIFNQVNDLMHARQILPRETGVLYNADGKQVFWSFQKQVLPLAEELSVQDLMQGTTQRSKEIAAEKHHVYLIG